MQFCWRQILNFYFYRQKQKSIRNEIKEQIELISDVRPTKYDKDFVKIKFKLDDDLPLGKMLKIPVCLIISLFSKKKQILSTSSFTLIFL